MGNTNKNRRIIAGIVLAILAAGLAGFFIGQYIEKEQYRAEQEKNILLNRSELDGLGEIEGKIYVTGHKNPDTDTVCSSMAYANLLKALGYEATPVVLGKINNETAFILEKAGAETPEYLEDASGLNMILVDHGEYSQSADGLTDANVISIIDHHGIGSVTTGKQVIYDARPLGSTSTIIWIRYRNYGVEIDKRMAALMLGAVLSDTSNLQGNITYADREAVKDLSIIAGISDTDAFYREMFKKSISYDGMTDEEIFSSDYKDYESSGRTYGIACVSAYDEASARDLSERMKAIMPEVMPRTGREMGFTMVSIYHDGISISYIIPSDETAYEVLAAAFGEADIVDGKYWRLEPGISRKRMVPAITDVLAAHPKE